MDNKFLQVKYQIILHNFPHESANFAACSLRSEWEDKRSFNGLASLLGNLFNFQFQFHVVSNNITYEWSEHFEWLSNIYQRRRHFVIWDHWKPGICFPSTLICIQRFLKKVLVTNNISHLTHSEHAEWNTSTSIRFMAVPRGFSRYPFGYCSVKTYKRKRKEIKTHTFPFLFNTPLIVYFGW